MVSGLDLTLSASGASGRESGANARGLRDARSIPGSGRSPGGEHSNPLQHSCLENPRDGGDWWAAIYGVAELDTTEAT